MKRILIILFVVSVFLCGCGSSPSVSESSKAPKIRVVDDNNSSEVLQDDISEKNSLANEDLERIVRETLEEDEKVEAAASDFEEPYQESDSDMSMSQKNAVKAAEDYLRLTSFSHKGLVDQLSSEYADKYSKEDAEFAVSYLEDHGMVDWNEQAVKAAREYLALTTFSREGLIDQLTSEYGSQFTREQAEYAVGQVGY